MIRRESDILRLDFRRPGNEDSALSLAEDSTGSAGAAAPMIRASRSVLDESLSHAHF